MKKLRYDIYAAAAGKSKNKDNNNLYIDGVIESGKIKSIESVSNGDNQLTKTDGQIISENLNSVNDCYVCVDTNSIRTYAENYFVDNYSSHFPEGADVSSYFYTLNIGSIDGINADNLNEDFSLDVDCEAEWQEWDEDEGEEIDKDYQATITVPASVVKPTLRYVYYSKNAIE